MFVDKTCIFPQWIGFCYLNTYTYEKSNDCMDNFWQQVVMFAFNVNNLLFSQVPAKQADTDKQW